MSEVKVYPPIILKPEDSFGKLLEKLYAEGWDVNSAEYMQADTLEEAVKLQAKSFPCLEFQPVQLSKADNQYPYHHEGKWVAFSRTPKPKAPDSYGDWFVYYNSTEKYWFLRNEKTLEDHPKHFDHPPTLEEIKEACLKCGFKGETHEEMESHQCSPKELPTEAKPEELKPARLVQVNKEGDGLCVVDGVTGNILETWEKEVTLNSIRLHFPDAIMTGNAQEFLNEQVEDKCPFGLSQDEACEDDICQQCEERQLVGEDIICGYFEPEPDALQDTETGQISEKVKDTSRIPIILTITAKITKRELTPQNQHPISLDINGKAHPYVSSGSDFGECSSHDTVEEAIKDLNDWIQSQKAWFTESYHRPIILKLETVNDVTTKQQNLQAFF